MLSTKKILLALISIPIFLNATEYQLSTHILDINSGQPASNVKVELYNLDQNRQWVKISEKFTKKNGRIADFLPYEKTENRSFGVYKLKFYTKDYYISHKVDSFYPFVEVSFELLKDQKHYHIPITLSPFGYSTYRGS
ncbi:hydroxyisourate hydrolase [Campylobacter coli]|uniref:5-hydroxyisourate hydrolase n=2 Tax=Campylobacter coli TaxID=195 RepID=A0A381CHL1_CAMCO|nr:MULTISPECIES: hydroxyisourate hydrolase [Campylobacter]EAK3887806.1 hydroxyisourate hydrolase [Campylobacter hyointestinalis]EAL3817020.1 hydroxyisourate hydrolase [Campylobacter fetus]EIA55349.1 transthyretin-like periplasmic protein [Campylobacter coli 2698]EIA57816.1 transthyretin-like periplasmic protein [Campylobacter coli 2692]EIA77629.1 transthyretin-like periplasmic protein [Campylobacter coli 132-6]EIA88112.1 transthyretin-like periplasmic protein [Campylobacter coli 67-8]EIB0509